MVYGILVEMKAYMILMIFEAIFELEIAIAIGLIFGFDAPRVSVQLNLGSDAI